MRTSLLALLLAASGACRDSVGNSSNSSDAAAAPARPAATARPEGPASRELGPPPEPPRLRADRGDCSTRYAPRPDRDRFPMCRVPGGTYMTGPRPGPPGKPNLPPTRARVGAFFIDQLEVTTAQYLHFLRSLGPAGLTDESLRNGWLGDRSIREVGGRYELDPSRSRWPIYLVTWDAARRYCEWAGKRLPTGEEWEYAARHDPKTGRTLRFPWGHRYDGRASGCNPELCVTQGYHHFMQDVGIHDGVQAGDGRSPTGVHDMYGNVQEWSADKCPHARIVCHHAFGRAHFDGGDFDDMVTESMGAPMNGDGAFAGIRCARDVTR